MPVIATKKRAGACRLHDGTLTPAEISYLDRKLREGFSPRRLEKLVPRTNRTHIARHRDQCLRRLEEENNDGIVEGIEAESLQQELGEEAGD